MNAAAEPRALPARVLLLGASGLIGGAVAARLAAEGVEVIGLARSPRRETAVARWIAADLRTMTRPEDWRAHLAGIEAVINCAGVLQDGAGDSTRTVHLDAPGALYRACGEAGVRRVIHLSAMNADRPGVTAFSNTKRAIEQRLAESELDWVVLRPSVVVGRAAYGGSALLRGLAALPLLPRIPGDARIAPVQLDDVVETVVRMLAPDAPSRGALDLAGPEALRFAEVVARYRRWLGWRPARVVPALSPLLSLGYRLGDFAGRLGWRPPVRTTARLELERGAVADPGPWTEATGIVPQSLDAALAREPASVQERWFARLYGLKPLGIVVFAAFWLLTGVVSLGPGFEVGMDYMRAAHAGPLAAPSVIAGGLADLAIGLGILWRRTTRWALIAAFALTLGYLVIGTLILPGLWRDPLGPMMKVWPILVLNLVLLAILDER